jgi:hypothetical protein
MKARRTGRYRENTKAADIELINYCSVVSLKSNEDGSAASLLFFLTLTWPFNGDGFARMTLWAHTGGADIVLLPALGKQTFKIAGFSEGFSGPPGLTAAFTVTT